MAIHLGSEKGRSDLVSAYSEFIADLELTAESESLLRSEAFFQLYAEAAVDSGDIEDAQYCAVLRDARPSYRIDGYYLNAEQGELGLIICDYRSSADLQPLNSSECEAAFGRVERFFANALDSQFINALESSSSAFQAAFLIHSSFAQIRRVRIILFSNAKLAIRKALVAQKSEGRILFTYNVLDFQRYASIKSASVDTDPVEIDLRQDGLTPIPCLKASAGEGRYDAYLSVVPASTLAAIYSLYGARLLEANVRVFLQARTAVNKGMQVTIREEPQNFFAYNNGLTATASGVEIADVDGQPCLTRIHDLQIVNGGQTTASVLYARDKEKRDLSHVFVQMKLSVVDAAARSELVPKISRYANSQNKISDADFFASHPFHQQIEKLSRRVVAPAREGGGHVTKWFYERTRGQYSDSTSRMTPAEKRRFEVEYPKSQRLVKTDLAKYEMAFACEPHTVSKGAQKCFLDFALRVDKDWDEQALHFGEGYFKDAMARAMIFRRVDSLIGESEWYQKDRAHKAQIVAYTIALTSHVVGESGSQIDYRRIWNLQAVPAELEAWLSTVAPKVAAVITNPPPNVRNIWEYCKQQACWRRVVEALAPSVGQGVPKEFLVSRSEAAKSQREEANVQRLDSGIDAQAEVVGLGASYWQNVLEFCKAQRMGSPLERSVLTVCASVPRKVPTDKQSVIALRVRSSAREAGFQG